MHPSAPTAHAHTLTPPSSSSSPRPTTPTAACSRRTTCSGCSIAADGGVDEAYIEFAGLDRSVARWVLERENLIVLRTFSKWAGIAGLRLGYGIFPSWLMPVAVAGQAAVQRQRRRDGRRAGLAGASGGDSDTVDALIVERERLIAGVGEVAVPAPLSQPGELRPLPGGRPGCEGAERGAGQRGASWCGTTPNRGWRTASGSARAGPEQTDALLAALAEV